MQCTPPDSRACALLPGRPPRRSSPRLSHWQRLLVCSLVVYLLSNALGSWTLAIPHAYATSAAGDSSSNITFADFVKQGRQDHAYTGPFVPPAKGPTVPGIAATHDQPLTWARPSSNTMQPINQVLDSSLLTSSTTGGTPLDLVGSDKHLEVLIQPGSIDVSQATTTGGSAPAPVSSPTPTPSAATPTPSVTASGTPGSTPTPAASASPTVSSSSAPPGSFTLQVRQLLGPVHSILQILAVYHLQIVDSQGHVVSGIRLAKPFTLLYHYQPRELAALHLDPQHMFLSYPDLLKAARKAHQSTDGLVLSLTNDATAQTLSTQSTTLQASSVALAGSSTGTGSVAPTPLLASEQGNSGQLGLRYPLSVAPNADGFVPQLTLRYSSQDTNGRTDQATPTSDEGEGWSLPIASISFGKSYSLNDLNNLTDRLIASSQANFYQTEHVSHLRIQQVTSSQTGQPCFQVYDRSGTFYEFGCTPDALQGSICSSYGWDLDRVVAPHEGPGSLAAYIVYHYLQDRWSYLGNCNGGNAIGSIPFVRDAGVEQITYGTQNAAGQPQTIAGTVDFLYRAPFSLSPWATAYGTNYNCSSLPPVSTTLRCDELDPNNSVMNTLSLQQVTSYVGDDSSPTHQAYQYQFSYHDTPFWSCADPIGQILTYCAGEHLLTSITPLVFQNGVAHPLKPVTLGYSQGTDHYADSSTGGSNSATSRTSSVNKIPTVEQVSTSATWKPMPTAMERAT